MSASVRSVAFLSGPWHPSPERISACHPHSKVPKENRSYAKRVWPTHRRALFEKNIPRHSLVSRFTAHLRLSLRGIARQSQTAQTAASKMRNQRLASRSMAFHSCAIHGRAIRGIEIQNLNRGGTMRFTYREYMELLKWIEYKKVQKKLRVVK